MNKIKELRLLKGLTREELARYVDINASNIAKFENGNRKLTVANAAKIAEYFNVSVEDLLGDDANLKNFVYHFVVEFAHEPSPMDALFAILKDYHDRNFDWFVESSTAKTLSDQERWAFVVLQRIIDKKWNASDLELLAHSIDLIKKAGK